MKVAVAVLFALLAVANAGLIVPHTTLVRTPSLDSAVVKFDRIGGNFAYSTVEAPAYAAISPVVKHVPTPVAVSYHATPVVVPAPAVPAPVLPYYYKYAPHYPLHY